MASVRLPEQRKKAKLRARALNLQVEIAERRDTLRATRMELAAMKPQRKKE